MTDGDLDENFEEYYRISEQLPTNISTKVLLNADGGVEFSGIIVLQPLPFASEETLGKLKKGEELSNVLSLVQTLGVLETAKTQFSALEKECLLIDAKYQCNC
jgi:redox-regulated HSP33 family molecular chaperone